MNFFGMGISTLFYRSILYSVLLLFSQAAIASNIGLSGLVKNASGENRAQTVKKPKLPNRGLPTGRRRGGTSRSECPAIETPLTAIVPGREIQQDNNQSQDSLSKLAPQTRFSDSESFLTKTIKEYPTFWIYVPELSDSYRAEFILQDESDRDVYRVAFDLPNKSGIHNIELPPQSPNKLKIGRKYHWYVKVFCGEEKAAGYIFVDPWLERIAISPQLQAQLNAENINRDRVLIDNNIWHDAIDYLARIQQTRLEGSRWNQLLTNLGLSDLIDKRILNTRANSLTE